MNKVISALEEKGWICPIAENNTQKVYKPIVNVVYYEDRNEYMFGTEEFVVSGDMVVELGFKYALAEELHSVSPIDYRIHSHRQKCFKYNTYEDAERAWYKTHKRKPICGDVFGDIIRELDCIVIKKN